MKIQIPQTPCVEKILLKGGKMYINVIAFFPLCIKLGSKSKETAEMSENEITSSYREKNKSSQGRISMSHAKEAIGP